MVIFFGAVVGLGAFCKTQANLDLLAAEMTAHIISSITSRFFIVQPASEIWAVMVVLPVVTGYLVPAILRLSACKAASVTFALFAALVVLKFALLANAAKGLQVVFPAALLVIDHLGPTTERFLTTDAGKLKSDDEKAETNRMTGLALQAQGRLDMAFNRFRRVPHSDALMHNLSNLVLDFGRKCQSNKAETLRENMATKNKDFRGYLLS